MKQKKIILVTGASGSQGGSVAKNLLRNGNFAVRILTNDPGSSKARALQQAGAEIITGDVDDAEILRQAMKGVHGVFGVTNYREDFDVEYKHGKNLVDAVKDSGVKHFVYSSLPDYYKISKGSIHVPHSDLKTQLQEYTKSVQLPFTFVHIAFYYENFLGFFPLQKDEDDNLYFDFPEGDTKLAMASVTDMGGVVATVFDYPTEYVGKTLNVVGEDKTCADYARIISKVLGRKVSYNHFPHEVYSAFGFPGGEELINMFEEQRLDVVNRRIDLIESYGLNPEMQSFEKWLTTNKEKFSSLLQVNRKVAMV
jgi:uncharacterized protein YbjT (DUF2867 family)